MHSCTSGIIDHNTGHNNALYLPHAGDSLHLSLFQKVFLCEVYSIGSDPCSALPCPALPCLLYVRNHTCPALAFSRPQNLCAALGHSDIQSLVCSVLDLEQGGWEWTRTPFAPLKGFEAMSEYPEYSTDFFDGCHYVVKGSSPHTHASLIRQSFHQKE